MTSADRLTWLARRAKRAVRAAPSIRSRHDEWDRFWSSLSTYERIAGSRVDRRLLEPHTGEDAGGTHVEPIYFFQDVWAFDRIVSRAPAHHIDVGSHHKFVAFLSVVVPTTMLDVRPLDVQLPSLGFVEASAVDLPFASECLPSVSSLCVIEHIGLGRYGDAIDPSGTERAARELVRVLGAGGDLYVSVPLDDTDRVYFNAHRAFTEPTVQRLFSPLELVEARYIYGQHFGDHLQRGFGTGCYHFRRT